MNEETVTRLGDELYRALRSHSVLAPLTEREPAITIDDAYRISLRFLQRRLADGEKLIGKKIGVTSKPVQDMLDVRQPDFGFLTDRMHYPDGAAIAVAGNLVAPRAEAEIAFRLKSDLVGPGITEADVLAATACIMPCFEIVDSRIRDWKIRIQDTVADNASCGVFVLGDTEADPRKFDLPRLHVRVFKNGMPLSEGLGSAVQGNPLTAVAWLANTLGRYDIPLLAGDIILSGSVVPLEPVRAGDEMRCEVQGMGSAHCHFV
ncbi:MAG: fumarylacetoacetate hydrolase family protein [Gammaproteobacteria bacterium]|jgi:2-oxopent-4-enoate/cis-2-oxohex-4-enoate hydratase|nr:fumarylacetoacetate hydrolase family protein [Gammaproteobacteria bacterium]MBP6053307.1 fumarylacetoacetate hydrolase family protein [Pseudomonadales bacterium]MBK6584145.1 fumarylacetoacetate hydrolase family protein [Gammaproteobacteria bacterium]MBK7168606.1 fumarylacetoacetate hydrolase family protein [Gammaproteobacteria bacterium]MBK7728182.1 fumarylacetoacetate hydrolase family protein [Gammaproteobacteria bacterium]